MKLERDTLADDESWASHSFAAPLKVLFLDPPHPECTAQGVVIGERKDKGLIVTHLVVAPKPDEPSADNVNIGSTALRQTAGGKKLLLVPIVSEKGPYAGFKLSGPPGIQEVIDVYGQENAPRGYTLPAVVIEELKTLAAGREETVAESPAPHAEAAHYVKEAWGTLHDFLEQGAKTHMADMPHVQEMMSRIALIRNTAQWAGEAEAAAGALMLNLPQPGKSYMRFPDVRGVMPLTDARALHAVGHATEMMRGVYSKLMIAMQPELARCKELVDRLVVHPDIASDETRKAVFASVQQSLVKATSYMKMAEERGQHPPH